MTEMTDNLMCFSNISTIGYSDPMHWRLLLSFNNSVSRGAFWVHVSPWDPPGRLKAHTTLPIGQGSFLKWYYVKIYHGNISKITRFGEKSASKRYWGRLLPTGAGEPQQCFICVIYDHNKVLQLFATSRQPLKSLGRLRETMSMMPTIEKSS